LKYFHAAGRLVGRAILDGQVLPTRFTVPIFKYMVGVPVSLDDIEFLDKQLYTSLIYIRDLCVTTEALESLYLDFSMTEKIGNEIRTVNLKPDGQKIEVNLANKVEYIDCVVRYLLVDRVQAQLEHFLTGLFEVCTIVY